MAATRAETQAAITAGDLLRAAGLCDELEQQELSASEQASIASFRAQIAFKVGDFASAAAAREREVALLQRIEAEPARVARVRVAVAWAHRRAGDFAKAATAAGAAYVEREVELGPTHDDTLKALELWIDCLAPLDRGAERLELCRTLIERRLEANGPDSASTADARARLARAEVAER